MSKCSYCFESMDAEASTTAVHDDGGVTHGACAEEYRNDECTECFHKRSTHGEDGCEHEHDSYLRDVAEAVRCSCPKFVRFTEADKYALSAIQADWEGWARR